MNDLIKLQGITKTYQNDFWSRKFNALENVSFSIPEGRLVGFLGANGAGKTTSMKIILGLIKPNEGKVLFHPSLGKKPLDVLQKIGHFPERPYFYPYLTGKEFLFFMGQLNDVKKDQLRTVIRNWAEKLQIDFALKRKIRSYSKGMLQRLGLISALIHDPKILLLDEPLSGMDPVGRREVKDVLLDLGRQGKTVFFSSHIVPDIEEICQDVVVLEKGRLLYQGGIQDLMDQNLQREVDICFMMNGEITQQSCFKVDLNSRLLQIMNLGGIIANVLPRRVSLEQIIYKVRNDEKLDN